MKNELLVIENVSADYQQRTVFRSLYLQLFQGDSLGLIFDSAYEKNVMLRLLRGELTLNGGRVTMFQKRLDSQDYPQYLRKNIGIIERERKLIRSLTIAENIFLCAPDTARFFVGRHSYDKPLERLCRELELDLTGYRDAVGHLPQKERIILEIAKLYAEGRKVMVFSNISSLLKEDESKEIYSLLKRIRKLGIGVIVIEAFEDIMFQWTDRYSVIKHGKTLGIYDSSGTDHNRIYQALLRTGRNTFGFEETAEEAGTADWHPELEFCSVTTDHLKDVCLSLGKGEVVKLYYTDDNSCTQIVELLKGIRQPVDGEIRLNEQLYQVKSISQAVKRGIGFIEEFSGSQMVLRNMSVFENVSFLMGEKIPGFWMRSRFQKSVREFLAAHFEGDIQKRRLTGVIEEHPEYLQQLVYYKWLLYHPDVVVCIKPFVQEDIHVRAMTVRMITALRQRGIGVLILTPRFNDIYLIDGENLFIRNGTMIDEDEVYQFLYLEQ